MKAPCEMESRILDAADGAEWSPQVRAHLDDCPSCADLMVVVRYLRAGDATVDSPPLPDPAQIWWKAQLRSRQDATERSLQPIALVEKIAYSSCAIILAAGAAWMLPRVRGLIHSLEAPASVPAFDGLPGLTVVLAASFLLFSMACSLYLLARE